MSKYYEFCVIKNGWMMGSYRRKAEATEAAKRYITDYPGQTVAIKAHVYAVPLDRYDVGDHYLYSYDVTLDD